MTVLRLDSFTIDPADAGELLIRHAALAAVAAFSLTKSLAAEYAEVLDA